MKKVLIISYYFPPAGGAGVQRTVKFVKYLPDFGWQPELLTVHQHHYRLTDKSMFAEIPKNTLIHPTPCILMPLFLPWRVRNAISRWLLVVDEQIGWYPFAFKTGKTLLQQGNTDVIYSTSSPYTSHLVAYSLKRAANLPWIADFRDPWIGNFAKHQPTQFHQRLDQSLESKVVHTADRVVVVSPPIRNDLLSRYPDLPEGRIVVITNGYDPADFDSTKTVEYTKDRLTIVYNGSFYTQELTPLNFFKGLDTAINARGIPRSQIWVYLVGNLGRPALELVSKSGLSDLIHVTGYHPHQESIAHLVNADLLLLVIGSSPASRAVFTGKLFEYLAARKPILALVPNGAAADLIREANAGVVVDPDNPNQIAETLAALYNRWSDGDLTIDPKTGRHFSLRPPGPDRHAGRKPG